MPKSESGVLRPPEPNADWRESLAAGAVKNLLIAAETLRTKLAIHGSRQERRKKKFPLEPLEKLYGHLALQLISIAGKNETERTALHHIRALLLECKTEIAKWK